MESAIDIKNLRRAFGETACAAFITALPIKKSFGCRWRGQRQRLPIGVGIVARSQLRMRCSRAVADLGELLPRRFRFALLVPHAGIEATGGEQLLMAAPFLDPSLAENDDFVGANNG